MLSIRRLVWLVLGLGALVLGCVSQPVKPAEPLEAGAESPVADDARWGAILSSLGQVQATESRSIKSAPQSVSGAKGDVRAVYRAAAPATVLIRSTHGFGTGIVLSSAGHVLTNHHVIAAGEQVGFKTRVTVELGRIGADGVMEANGEALAAWVLKSDPLVDLALIQLESPPKGLATIHLARRDPSPGEPVSALGNGSIGLLWAIKDGEISSVGRLGTHLAQIVGGECRVMEDTEAAEACRKASAGLEVEKRRLSERMPALVIQSSCTLSPGDSGGPLVNRAGELVGVNAFLKSDPRIPVTTNFHIHLKEIRAFLKQVPTQPRAQAPSPWERAALGGRWSDGDLDGVPDVLAAGSLGHATAFADLKQRTPNPEEIRGALAMTRVSADVAVADIGGRAFAWYDVDGDGRFERLVVEDDPKAAAQAWALGPGFEVGAFLGAAKFIDPEVFTDETRRTRLSAVAPTLLRAAGLEGHAEAGTAPVPRPDGKGLRFMRTVDVDRDGTPDGVSGTSPSGTWTFIDPLQQHLGVARGPALSALLEAKAAKFPVVLHTSRDRRFIFLQEAGKPTVALVAEATERSTIAHAHTVDADGALGAELPVWFGRDVARAVANRYQGKSRERLERLLLPSRLDAKLSLPSGFPHPVGDVGRDVRLERCGAKALELSVVSVSGWRGSGGAAMLFELDAAELAALTPEQRLARAREGDSGADAAWVRRGPWTWTYFDTTHDGAFDLVLVSNGDRLEARRLDGAIVHLAPEQARRPMLRTGLLPDAERAKALRTCGQDFFGPDDLGE